MPSTMPALPERRQGTEFFRRCKNPECPLPKGTFFTDEPRQHYCSVQCKKAVKNQKYYTGHRSEVLERVKANKKK